MKFLKKLMALILAINMAFSGTLPVFALELEEVGEETELFEENILGESVVLSDEEPEEETFFGKKVSILSHSASTYAGVSNNTADNSTIGKNDVYYTEGRHGVYRKDTWWQQAADALGMEVLVNNSWSGSCIFQPRKGAASVCYDTRAVNLHNDHTGEEPDVIWVYIGGNDFAYYKDTFGKASDVDYSALIKENSDGTFSYAEPNDTCEAYAITLHKIQNRYPDAGIYCMTSTARRETDYTGDNYPDAGQPTEYCAELWQIAEDFGFPVVDLEKAIPKEVELFDKYMGDKRAHPNALGMDQITNEVLSVMLGEESEIRHVISKDGTANEQAVLLGGSYNAEIELPEGYTLSVKMSGEDITDEVYSGGKIFIEEVTGDIEITAERGLQNFRWELKDDVFDSVSGKEFTENELTLLEGSISDGIFSGVKYSLADEIYLNHDKPWVMEWAVTGNWDAALFAKSPTSGIKDAEFIFRSSTDYELFAIGAHDGTQYNNYGIATKELGLDMTKRHVYRLENRIAQDGSNMVCLLIDGKEIGPMNRHFIGSKKDTENTSDWVSGKDFSFGYMGTVVRAINYCSLEYIEVWENGHEHAYKGTVCSDCGLEHPNAENYKGKVFSVLGDSISTFAGYIPKADGFNLEHLARYPQDNLLTDVNETWWMQVIAELDGKLGINDSWRGSTVSGYPSVTTGVAGYLAAMSNITQIQNLGSNGTPNVIMFYGGTNDFAHTPNLGSFDPKNAPTEVDLETLKWDNLANAYCHALLRLEYYYPDTEIIAMLPTYTKSYYSNDKLAQGNALLKEICEHYGVKYIDLRDCGISVADLPDGIHPDAKGMDYITDAVIGILLDECETKAGENMVYSVTHNLENAKAEKHYYKGASAGKAFVETISGENLSVSVTMGGKNITAEVYEDGKIIIASVNGDIIINAKGEKEPVYAEYIQDLPEDYYGKDLWKILEHYEEYYTVSGWGIHSSGAVRSVTFEVKEGEKIYASSFEKAGINGTTATDGIRITFFNEDDILVSMSADAVYKEFAEKGYITVPKNAKAVNIPMWTDSLDWELYVYDSSYEPEFSLGEHLEDLPEKFCAGTNLWTALEPENKYYTGSAWGNISGNSVYSLTISVEENVRIFATSFGKSGENGGSRNGIRITWFGEDGVIESVGPDEVYAEFTVNGYITVPEGATAVNVPMWDNSDENEIYLLDRGHVFESGRCASCGYERIVVGKDEIIQYQGGVNAGDGKINDTFTNNWYTDMRIPEGAEKVRFITFKTSGNWGSAFMNGKSFVSGYSDKTTGGKWVTLDIPEKADVFRYGYLYDEIAESSGIPYYTCVDFYGKEMQPILKSEFMERPETSCHAFSVEVNIASALGKTGEYVPGTDYGYIVLPTTYSSYGDPTRLIIVCHGAGAEIGTYKSDAKKNNNYTFWTELGYAVMDMYACPTELSGSDSCLHYGNPSVLECYKAGYDYVMKNFNLKTDGIFVIGSSMGGLSSFQIVQSGEFPVIAQVGYCPVIDIFKQAYCNPWTTASYQRSKIAQYFGFEGTNPQFTNTKFPSDAEIEYFRENIEKLTEYSPLYNSIISGSVEDIFGVVPNFSVGFSDEEANLYKKLTAAHPCPIMIFHNLDDSTVSYRYSEYFKEMVERSGQKVFLHTFETGGHNAWDNGSAVSVQGINKNLSLSVSKNKAYEFFKGIEDHSEHCSWVDPAVAPTCTESGLTEGSHCAYCEEVLAEQKVIPATGHSFGDWYETEAPTFVKEGEERRDCANCEHYETRTVEKKDGTYGDVNEDGEIDVMDANIVRRYAVKLVDLSEKQMEAADVSGDGKVNVIDANLIRRYVAKLLSEFPVEG